MQKPYYQIDVWPDFNRELRTTITRVSTKGSFIVAGRYPEQGPVLGKMMAPDATLSEVYAVVLEMRSTYWDDPDLHSDD